MGGRVGERVGVASTVTGTLITERDRGRVEWEGEVSERGRGEREGGSGGG